MYTETVKCTALEEDRIYVHRSSALPVTDSMLGECLLPEYILMKTYLFEILV